MRGSRLGRFALRRRPGSAALPTETAHSTLLELLMEKGLTVVIAGEERIEQIQSGLTSTLANLCTKLPGAGFLRRSQDDDRTNF